MPKGIPLTEENLNRRRREILNAALHLFVEKGFPETSMREIAEAAGVGKSTLYDYFSSKDEILIAFVVDEVHQIEGQAREIIAQDLSAAEKLRRILRAHLDYMLANKRLNLKLSYEAQRLSVESIARIQEHRHDYQDMLCDLLQEGIRNGEFRPVNPLLAIRSMFSLITTTVYTTRPTGTPEQMLQEALDIIFKGLEA
jgi:TetR/AcrR family transcriptional regulator, cholesterol catabolism regulator